MKTLVIYDSQYGNTEEIAHAIAYTLRTYGDAQAVNVEQVQKVLFQGVNLLILGCPTQGFRPTPAMQTFFGSLSTFGTIPTQNLRSLAVACFDTRFRGFLWQISAARHLNKQFRAMGIEPIIPAESFFVKGMKKEGPLEAGEVKRASDWAIGIYQSYEARADHLAVH
jgi:flavodoxin